MDKRNITKTRNVRVQKSLRDNQTSGASDLEVSLLKKKEDTNKLDRQKIKQTSASDQSKMSSNKQLPTSRSAATAANGSSPSQTTQNDNQVPSSKICQQNRPIKAKERVAKTPASPKQQRAANSTTQQGQAQAGANKKSTKPRRRVATMAQRRAANIRERRRMYNLNTAFDRLRKKVPSFAYEKRLSRIETLKLAIMYIKFMDDLVKDEAYADKYKHLLASTSCSASSSSGYLSSGTYLSLYGNCQSPTSSSTSPQNSNNYLTTNMTNGIMDQTTIKSHSIGSQINECGGAPPGATNEFKTQAHHQRRQPMRMKSRDDSLEPVTSSQVDCYDSRSCIKSGTVCLDTRCVGSSISCCSPSATISTTTTNCNSSMQHLPGSDTSSPATNHSVSPQSVHHQPTTGLPMRSSQGQLSQAHGNNLVAFHSSADHPSIIPSSSSSTLSDLSPFSRNVPSNGPTGHTYNQAHPYDNLASAATSHLVPQPYSSYEANSMRHNDKFYYQQHQDQQQHHVKSHHLQQNHGQQNLYQHHKYGTTQGVYDYTQTHNPQHAPSTTANGNNYSSADYFGGNHYPAHEQQALGQHKQLPPPPSGYSLHSLEAR